jgi:oxygen-independent coproporphyrinogen-3 oxidase
LFLSVISFYYTKNLQLVINGILQYKTIAKNHKFSFGRHSNNTTKQHLQKLYNLWFRIVSFGVQDYSPIVQEAIHPLAIFGTVLHKTKKPLKTITQIQLITN